jgi:glycosyltransferase involved in cell wall biosynthesis
MPEKGARGGPPVCEPPFARALREMGEEVQEEIYSHATETGWAGRAARVRATAQRMGERMRAENFDIVHINTSFDKRALLRDAFVVPGLPETRARIFLKFHGSDARLLESRNPAWVLLRQRLFARAAGIGVLSSEERGNFQRAGVPEAKLFLVANVVERICAEGRAEFLRRQNLPDDKPLLLFIGRFIAAKGLLDTIRACALLREREPEAMLLCVGDGPARAEAEAEARRSGLGERVRFFGYLPEEQTAGFYAHSSALIFPTVHYEGFPLAIFQAAAAGLPIMTTRIRAAADYLREPENCLWTEPRRPDVLAEQISRLLGSGAEAAELRAGMSSNNRLLAERFSAGRVAGDYLEIYRRLV